MTWTLFRIGAVQVFIAAEDHPPPHVHAFHSGEGWAPSADSIAIVAAEYEPGIARVGLTLADGRRLALLAGQHIEEAEGMVKTHEQPDGWALPSRKQITTEMLDRAISVEDRLAKAEHHASEVWFDARHDVLALVLTDGRVFGAKRELIPSLAEASLRQLRSLRATDDGVFLVTEALDLHINVDGLVTRLLEDSVSTVRRLGARMAGSTTSPAKAEASARNGRLGGRPRKTPKKDLEVA